MSYQLALIEHSLSGLLLMISDTPRMCPRVFQNERKLEILTLRFNAYRIKLRKQKKKKEGYVSTNQITRRPTEIIRDRIIKPRRFLRLTEVISPISLLISKLHNLILVILITTQNY